VHKGFAVRAKRGTTRKVHAVKTYPKSFRAFTLAELLTVVAVIALLLAIVSPMVGGTVAYARQIKCAANLRHLSQAYHLCINDDARDNDNVDPISPNIWTQNLEPYLVDNANKAMICPEDSDPTYGNIDVGLQIYVKEDRPGLPTEYATELFNVYPYWLEGPCPDPGPGIWKLNDEKYTEFVTTFGNSQAYAPAWLPQYTPGDDPDSWHIVVEEGRLGGGAASDVDYNDLLIHLKRNEDGSIEATFERTWYWVSYALIMPDGSMIGGENESLGAEIMGPITLPTAARASYGMNWQAPNMPAGSNRILMIDYDLESIKNGGNTVQHEDWDLNVAPRHAGGTKVNVLFNNGAVQPLTPDAIDPDVIENDERYWSPE